MRNSYTTPYIIRAWFCSASIFHSGTESLVLSVTQNLDTHLHYSVTWNSLILFKFYILHWILCMFYIQQEVFFFPFCSFWKIFSCFFSGSPLFPTIRTCHILASLIIKSYELLKLMQNIWSYEILLRIIPVFSLMFLWIKSYVLCDKSIFQDVHL